MSEISLSQTLFDYPDHLIATEPSKTFRAALWVAGRSEPEELLSKQALFDLFRPEDALVINDTLVEKRRVFLENGIEIVFLAPLDARRWQVLLPLSRLNRREAVELPGGVRVLDVRPGLPQILELEEPLPSDYFDRFGQLALPPYIQKARGQRQNVSEDARWYQTAWAERSGSVAAPTASLHFDSSDLEELGRRGVAVERLTLHVGLGTFEPIRTDDIRDHAMHAERFEVSDAVWSRVQERRRAGGRIWALGTTVVRALESRARGLAGETSLFIKPGEDYRVVGGLLTNFHQPGSTLILLVAAFAGLETVLSTYRWAIQRNFRLFSYGDLSVWIR